MEKKKQGFALLSKAKRSEIAAMGGNANKPENRYFSRNKEAAKVAGRLGGLTAAANKAKAK